MLEQQHREPVVAAAVPIEQARTTGQAGVDSIPTRFSEGNKTYTI